MRRLILLGLAVTAGCHETISLPLPPIPVGGSVILVEPETEVAWAIDHNNPNRTIPAFVGIPEELVTVGFSCPTEDYGAMPGELETLEDGLAIPLAQGFPPVAAFNRYDAEADAWLATDSSEAVENVLARRTGSAPWCQLTTPLVHRLIGIQADTDEQLAFVESARLLTDGRLLVNTSFSDGFNQTSTTGYASYIVDGEEADRLDPPISSEAILATFDRDDGRWFAFDRRGLHVGEGLELQTITTTTGPGFIVADMDGAKSGPDEIWIVGTRGVVDAPEQLQLLLLRYQNGQLQTIRSEVRSIRETFGQVTIIWIGPNEVYVRGFGESRTLLHVKGDQQEAEVAAGGMSVSYMLNSSTGVIAAGRDASLYRRGQERWQNIGEEQPNFFINALWELSPGRILATGRPPRARNFGWFNNDVRWASCPVSLAPTVEQILDRTREVITLPDMTRRIFQANAVNDQLTWIDFTVVEPRTPCEAMP